MEIVDVIDGDQRFKLVVGSLRRVTRPYESETTGQAVDVRINR